MSVKNLLISAVLVTSPIPHAIDSVSGTAHICPSAVTRRTGERDPRPQMENSDK